MSAARDTGSVLLEVQLLPEPDADPATDEEVARRIRREVLDSGADGVELLHGDAPPDAKAIEGVLAGLAVKMAPGAVGAVLDAIRSVAGRSGRRRVRIRVGDRELEIEGASTDAERQLIDAFVAGVATTETAGT